MQRSEQWFVEKQQRKGKKRVSLFFITPQNDLYDSATNATTGTIYS